MTRDQTGSVGQVLGETAAGAWQAASPTGAGGFDADALVQRFLHSENFFELVGHG